MKAEQNFEKRHRLAKEVIETVVLTALMFLIINLAVQNYDVEGPSMEPSLHHQERIMVDKVSYKFHSPARGDVIVFVAPPHPELNYVKRIIGIPGDVITIQDIAVSVDGVTLKESYVAPSMQGNPNLQKNIPHLVVPADHYFVMGDDRINSSDSREWGFLPAGNIVGRAALVYWPLGKDNNGFLPNVSSVFANVHQASNKTSRDAPTALLPVDGLTTLVEDSIFLGIAPALLLLSARYRKKRT